MMKERMRLLSLFFPLLLVASLQAQMDVPKGLSPVKKSQTADFSPCIVEGNADCLFNYLHENVEITLLGDRNGYAKTQARFVLKDFFSKYPPSSFSIIHEGATENTVYALGEYRSTKGLMEVNVFLKNTGLGYSIHQIRFERK